MLSTRVKLTAAFVAGLAAVTITLFLAVLAARNNAVYHDISLYAAAQGDLAARVITDAVQSKENVFVTSDTALIPLLSPKVAYRLQSVPGYIVVVDTAGRAVHRSNDVIRLQGAEMAAITDGRSLHRRLALSEETTDFADLVTTLNAMISRLETSFAGLRRFTADASHELKTPLTVLRADVERAMTDTSSQTERMIALEEALQEVRRMSDLVESLLTLARADEGRFDLHREPVELQPLVQEVYETALILGEAQGVTVNLPFTADAVVMGDRTRLRQLFLNLVTNAIKYTPAGGKVELGLGRHPDNTTFAVRDTGIGISAADFPHVFERFWRADRVRSRMSERGGFGLGLAISQWIAQAHGGTLTASSRLGRGSLFTVTLPVANEAPQS